MFHAPGSFHSYSASFYQLLFTLIFLLSLLVLAIIDIKTLTLPDSITLPMVWLGLLVNSHSIFSRAEDAIFGAVCGYLFFFLISHLMLRFKGKEALGRGDAKLLAMLGAWLGWQMLPLVVFLSSFTGSIFGLLFIFFKGKNFEFKLPYGPFLATAAVLVFATRFTR